MTCRDFSSPLATSDALLNLLDARIAEHVKFQLGAREPSPRWLTVPEAADHLRTSKDGIRALVKRNKLPCHRAGGRVLFDRAELDDWVRGEAA